MHTISGNCYIRNLCIITLHFAYLSVCVCVCVYVCVCVCVYIYLFIYLSIDRSLYQLICSALILSCHLPVCLYTCAAFVTAVFGLTSGHCLPGGVKALTGSFTDPLRVCSMCYVLALGSYVIHRRRHVKRETQRKTSQILTLEIR